GALTPLLTLSRRVALQARRLRANHPPQRNGLPLRIPIHSEPVPCCYEDPGRYAGQALINAIECFVACVREFYIERGVDGAIRRRCDEPGDQPLWVQGQHSPGNATVG